MLHGRCLAAGQNGLRRISSHIRATCSSAIKPCKNRSKSSLHASQASKTWYVLGIESSCDDTGAAVVTSDGRVLGEALATQEDIHAAWGGVVPKLAMEAHQAAIDGVVAQALQRAGLEAHQLDAVAVTIGPGLGLCLRVGVTKANELSRQHNLPLIHVHHMEAHAFVARLGSGLTPAPETQSSTSSPVASQSHNATASPQPPQGTASPIAQSIVSSSSREPHTAQPSHMEADSSSSSSSFPGSSIPEDERAHTSQQQIASTGLCIGESSNSAETNPDGSRRGDTGSSDEHTEQTRARIEKHNADFASILLHPAVPFPFLCLLVSGGHNLLVLVTGVGQYVQLGTTLDDALGEAYDKVARLLQLDPRPSGGAALERLAKTGNPRSIPFAIPMWQRLSCDFSYAGLKTSARLAIQANLPDPADPEKQQVKADLAASFQYAAVKHLTQRVARGTAWARELQPGLQHLVVAGGVASNQYVRQQLAEVAEQQGLIMTMPPPRWCVDNGVMVAWAGMERLALGLVEPPLPALPELPAVSLSEAVLSSSTVEDVTLLSEASNADSRDSVGGLCGSYAQSNFSSSSGSSSSNSIKSECLDPVVNVSGVEKAEEAPKTPSVGSMGAWPGTYRSDTVIGGEEYVILKPRWPLTSEKHPRCVLDKLSQKSARKVRLHTSLNTLMQEQQQQQQQQQAGPSIIMDTLRAAGIA